MPVRPYESAARCRVVFGRAMEDDKRIAEYQARIAEAERNAAQSSDPKIAKEWLSVAQVYRVMIDALRPPHH
jgi:hypothetical protein